MGAGNFGVRLGCQRGPPELGLEALAVDLVNQRAHVGVATRKFRLQQVPIAIRRLPAIVYPHPGEAQLLGLRQGVDHLGRGERPAVAPRAPDGFECRRRRRLEVHPPGLHHFAVSAQGAKIIALMHGSESCGRYRQRFAGA